MTGMVAEARTLKAENAALMRLVLWLGLLTQRAGAVPPGTLADAYDRTVSALDGLDPGLKIGDVRVLASVAPWKAKGWRRRGSWRRSSPRRRYLSRQDVVYPRCR